ncbi:MAG: activase [Nitrospiraceae bacterium]|nr:activase [Nitrospiraceae bacterium]
MESLGICLGASTIGLARLRRSEAGIEVVSARTCAHEGNPRNTLRAMIEAEPGAADLPIAATGRKFRRHVSFATIAEPEAVERATADILPDDHPYRVVVSAGGETFMLYHLDPHGQIQDIHTGNKCASGTGEFLLQQIGRMDVTLDDVARMEMPGASHKVSGRCSVFCKSDCTHALNKGIPKEQVVAGLARMMAGKILELLTKLPHESVMLIGGCAANQSMVHYLREAIPDLYIPEAAPWFEAYGAALWALGNGCPTIESLDDIFVSRTSSLSFLKPLSDFRDKVHFKQHPRATAQTGDRTILGLDVGSTTTKGVVMRRSDKAILASDYLRTNGDPVGASRRVYRSLAEQIDVPITIEGLGVTGSGRQIAGLHAMTDGVINEIIAHATAAVHFDPEVDTIFEIGGQDAKYTYITNGVPSDYAMNEACSAGTGSFLEESAKESLGLDVTAIGPAAYQAQTPPNFNDQCAAFIGSDIKGAAQEGISVPDIVAGLVYSICMNYANRVKGNRPVGKKVFMQGGVCYNEAIPAAMAALIGAEMIVPPEPGLMGALGVALEVERRLEHGLIESAAFDLNDLAQREVRHRDPFVCAGGPEKCDRACEIARIEIDGKIYPFGGTCNRFDNMIHKRKMDTTGFNLVVERERRLFRGLAPDDSADKRPTVGLNRSFLVNTYFPLYNRFFAELGFRAVLPGVLDPTGADHQGAAFCFPVELAHGYAATLAAMKPDYIFLPHVRGINASDRADTSCTCVFIQGEPFYLRTAFPEFATARTLTPCFDFSDGIESNTEAFRDIAHALGVDVAKAEPALQAAIAEQQQFHDDIRAMGAQALADVREDPSAVATVLFGRPYNSFVAEANKGIPAKFASRGIRIIPYDMLPFEDEPLEGHHHMYWAMGRQILKAAQAIAQDSQLFGAYITNFSCGPDSFIVAYFRDIMGRKPSLTLELDNHTADAGIETRIEAFLDIIQYYRQLKTPAEAPTNGFTAAVVEFRDGKTGIRASNGEWFPLDHKRVKVVVPAMGRYGTIMVAKAFGCRGIRAEVLPPANDEILKLGRANSSCKECLPLQTTVGQLLHYLETRSEDEITAYFMLSTDGPCRFGQYHVFSKRLIDKQALRDVAVLSLTTANGYGGLGDRFALAAWRGVIIGDLFDEMWATILAAAVDREEALATLDREHQAVAAVIHKSWPQITRQLTQTAKALSSIRLTRPYHELPKISLVGEIYVRNDPISLQGLVESLAERGFVVRTSKISEWLKYLDWLVKNGIENDRGLMFWVRYWVKDYFDRAIRKRMAPAGLFFCEKADVDPVVEMGAHFISPNLTGEAILTVGAALHESLHPSCGVISIGPFGCMPSRVAESVLSEKLTTEVKRAIDNANGHTATAEILAIDRKLPFLAVETDGNTFPQLIEARLEAFCLQAQRINEQMLRE